MDSFKIGAAVGGLGVVLALASHDNSFMLVAIIGVVIMAVGGM